MSATTSTTNTGSDVRPGPMAAAMGQPRSASIVATAVPAATPVLSLAGRAAMKPVAAYMAKPSEGPRS